MGVKNLWPILTPICERKSLWELHDKAVAIDLSCWVCDSQNVENFNQPRMYLRNLFFRTSFLLLLGVKPLFVLEGRAPTLKHDVMSQRVHQRRHNKKQSSSSEEESSKMSQRTRAERNTGSRSRFNSVLKQCEELLTIMGVPCVQSLGEAEALCAKLNEAGLVDGCITQDGDCFLYGAQTVYRNFTISHQGSTGCSVEEYKMDIIEAKLSLSRQKLIALSLFCGCDYNDKGVLGVGKETALKFLEGLEDDKVLPRLKQWRTDPRYEQLETEYAALSNTCSKCSHSGKLQKHAKSGCEACDTRNDCIQTTDTHRLSQKAPEERKAIIAELTMRRKALLDENFPSQAMVDEFLHRQPLPKFDLSWKQPDIASFIKYSAKLLNWTETYAMEKFIPLVTRWQLHSLEATGNSDQSTLPFMPSLIVKKRVLKGVQSYEVRWKILLCNLEFMEEIVTTEPQEMFGAAYPDLVEEYVKEKESKSRKGNIKMQQFVVATMKPNKSCGFLISKYAKHTLVQGKVIAVRREDQSVWERRAPVAPSNVRRLTRAGVKVIVQPSNRRAYPMQTYAAAGAVIQEDISEASVIFGVKQAPVDLLIPNKTYCLFSHTIKAQEANMPLLDAILEKNIRLIDYEKLMDERGQRVVAFGKYAGLAGMVNILHGLGLRLLALGHHTPFMHIGPAHNYRNSSMALQAIRDAGYEIALGMMPKSIGPLTFVFTGSGNVSQGGQEVFQELPHEYVPPDMLRKVAEHGSHTKIYGCEVRRRHHLERKEGGGFDSEEYEKFPSRYISTFSKKIAPYASVIINGIYWAIDSPKLLTIPDAKTLLRPANTPWLPSSVGSPSLPHRMLAICDISADPGGSVEFMNECTTIDTPFCLYDADRNKDTKSFKGPGVLVCSIDNMPTQLPREATDFFGDLLYPYAFDILQSDATQPLESHNFGPSVTGAIIASNGKLTPNFEYIHELRLANRGSRHKVPGPDGEAAASRVIVLGAGMVCAPLVEYLHRDNNLNLTVASALKDEADAVAGRYPGVESVLLDVVERSDMLQDLVGTADLVVSLLPSALHYLVAEACVNAGVHLVTASYCTDELKEMHNRAVERGITILNEVGLDPGIDHLLAMECFDEVHQAGGKVESFISYCGGLPAPECSDNALRYKFSWNPRGVLLNTLGTATYIQDGQVIQIPGGGQVMRETQSLDFLPGFALEGFPNRDSTKYAKLYGIVNESRTVLRGTLRFKGFADTIQCLQLLGLMDPNPHPALHPKGPDITWRQLVCTLLGVVDSSIFYENLKTQVAQCVGTTGVNAIESLGLLEEHPVLKLSTPLDSLSHLLSRKLSIANGERDLVVLRHEVSILWPDGRRELRGINLVEYGEIDGHSAMAKAVGFPAAIASKMILDGEIQEKGCILPFTPDIYRPILSRLRAEGLRATERSQWF